MAGNSDAFAFVLASVRRTLAQLESDSGVVDPVRGRGAALAAHVTRMLTLVTERVDAAETTYPTRRLPEAQDAVVRNLRFYANLARALHESLPWLDAGRSSTLDLGTCYFIDEMALAIVGRGTETVTVPNTSYMYSTLSWPFRLTAREHLKVDVATGTRPIVLFFPLKESSSVLFHALFAHELGHSGVDEHDLVSRTLQAAHADPAFADRLQIARRFLESTGGFDPTAAERVVRARLAAWTEELLCDALALHYLGPSYLFAFAAFVLASNWTDPRPTHPPPILRIRLLVEQLEALGWDAWLSAVRPRLWAWFAWAAQTELPPMNPDNAFLRDVVAEQTPAIQDSAREQLGHHVYGPSSYRPQEADLGALLARRILPAELDAVAVDRRSILLAGWMYALTYMPDGTSRDDGPASLCGALSETGLQRFIGKALELSTISEIWGNLP